MNILIRPVQEDEYDSLGRIFDAAKAFMRRNGNPTQWENGYPDREMMLERVRREQLFLIEADGTPHAVFAFIIGKDPTYARIEDGSWLSDDEYGTIHSLASDGFLHGVFDTVLSFCLSKTPHLRFDTHRDNLPMQNLAKKYDFSRRGIIYVADGTPRIAYEKIQR